MRAGTARKNTTPVRRVMRCRLRVKIEGWGRLLGWRGGRAGLCGDREANSSPPKRGTATRSTGVASYLIATRGRSSVRRRVTGCCRAQPAAVQSSSGKCPRARTGDAPATTATASASPRHTCSYRGCASSSRGATWHGSSGSSRGGHRAHAQSMARKTSPDEKKRRLSSSCATSVTFRQTRGGASSSPANRDASPTSPRC